MLIGIAHPSFATTGGAEILLERQAIAIRAHGHRLRVVTMAFDAARWPGLATASDVQIVPKRWSDALVPNGPRRQQRRVARQAARLHGVDAVLASGYPANVVAAASSGRRVWYCNEPSRRLYFSATYPALVQQARRNQERSHLFEHVRRRSAEDDSPRSEIATLRVVDRDAVARVDAVVANSAYASARLWDVYARRADAVIHPTIPGPKVRPPARRGVSTGGLRVLVHSRLELLKNVETVLHGFAAFVTASPGSHELHVVGSGPYEARLREVASCSPAASRIRFHGFLDEAALTRVYESCDVLAALPPDEPFGMVFPEAALRGLLLIGPDHGGPAEILDGGRYGWMVDAFAPDALAEALARVNALSHEDADRRREAAASACEARFGASATIPPLLALLGAVSAR